MYCYCIICILLSEFMFEFYIHLEKLKNSKFYNRLIIFL